MEERIDSRILDQYLERYDRPGPRYTSYPPATSFHTGFGAPEYEAHLAAAAAQPDTPLSLYVHLPFCESRCAFCACHAVVTQDRSVAETYLDHLVREIELVADRLGDRGSLAQYHWGGGTPTYSDVPELARLHEAVVGRFELLPNAECAVEVDPRVTSDAQLAALRSWGFNRISLGVQDLDPTVQSAIGRDQTERQTRDLLEASRRHGFASVNMDLVYGLPAQSVASFRETLEAVCEMRPDRLAVYSFALVPWVRPHQRRIDSALLPERSARLRMLAMSVEVFTQAGYERVGMDHWALPDDELVKARRDGHLYRNFMGYTVSRAPDVIGLGVSAIGDVAGAFVQNHKRLRSYYDDLERGALPVERGTARSADDEVRRHVIMQIMCNGSVDWREVGARHGIVPSEYFGTELAALATDADLAALVEVEADRLVLTDLGSYFPRNVAMVFDTHLGRTAE
ncbi:MAG: oxygen-independent coproporphyrinogen III oxidase, partial [Acidimicrobiia bacterium]|nr:oxygen-independent coproporphyrinogen III oxidase [Acidimicrobiia bacterium]